MPDHASLLIDAYLRHWLRNAGTGREQVQRLGFENALSALWELLNAGFVKLETGEHGFRDVVPCMPPEPPEAQIQRPI